MDSNNKPYRCMYSSRTFASESHFNLGRPEFNYKHKKRHCLDIGSKHDKKVKCHSDRRSSRLEMGLSDVVWLEDGSPSSAVGTLAIIKEDDEGVSEWTSSVMNVFGDILLRIANHGDQWAASQLTELLTDTSLDLNILR